MGLREYKRKRHFDRTAEPEGKVAAKEGRSFVIQKHAARNLHYDFRLEFEGVLKSWAVPKGPSLDPAVKRLAMQVEDHPVAYGGFEGIIPAGEYGGGTVMLWDRGTWEPIGDAAEGFRKGRLKFLLHGEKLHGGWMLIRTKAESEFHPEKQRWLLFKEHDDEARSAKAKSIVEELPASVATGRSLEEIANDQDAVWSSNGRSNGKARPTRRKARPKPPDPANLYDARKKEFAGVRLTSPDKVLYPEQGITKLELAEYYRTVADWILPQIADRPLVLVRCPEGRAKSCFYQKHPPPGSPDTLRRITIREKTKAEPYLIADDVAGLISLAQIGTLEIHAWGSRADKLEQPDRLIFDLDPDPTVAWSAVVQSAREVRAFLEELGLQSFVKLTGGKGVHLVVPIRRQHEWDEVKAFCKLVADSIVQAAPDRFTANISKAARPHKILIDYLRNGRGATAVVAYSTRSRPNAPVATPLAWEELSAQMRPDHYTIRNLPRRLSALKRDPWADLAKIQQSLTPAMKALREIAGNTSHS
jgi:bifunctional non-homologous end joining protein LigD